MGKVGPGWSRTLSNQIRKQLREIETHEADSKVQGDVGRSNFQAEVGFRDITSEGFPRAASSKAYSKANDPRSNPPEHIR